MVTLSILIATTASRKEMLDILLKGLIVQCGPEVEILIDDHETNCIGKKRNDLLARANGEWQVAIDSDDIVSDDYVSKILEALKFNPDCVGINGIITTDGGNERQWYISKDFGSWYERNLIYYRTPNHISPIRTSIARQVGFPEIAFGEDSEFSKRVLSLLKSEVVVRGNIYHYRFIRNKNGE